MNESYDADRYAGSRFKNSQKGVCPHCGVPISHGLYGNPKQRRIPPCLQAKTPAQAAALLSRYSIQRRRGKRELARRQETAISKAAKPQKSDA